MRCPARAKHFPGSRGRENGKFEHQGCGCLSGLQIGHEGGQLGIVHRRVMTAREQLALW
jgi:hypothetical protein